MPKLVRKTPTIEPPKPKMRPRLTELVTENKYLAIKLVCQNLAESNISLREIWAVVDHLVEVAAGREIEVYAAVGKKAVVNQSSATKPGTRLSRR